MPIIKKIVATLGSYTNSQGDEKRKYQNVGVLIEKDGKMFVKLDSLVNVNDEGQVVNFFLCYDLDKKKESAPAPAPTADPDVFFDDDIPL